MKHLKTFESFAMYEAVENKEAQKQAEELVSKLSAKDLEALKGMDKKEIDMVSKEVAEEIVQAQKESKRFRMNESVAKKVSEMSEVEKKETKSRLKEYLVKIGLGVVLASSLAGGILFYLAATGVVVTGAAIATAVSGFLGTVVSVAGIASEVGK
jgi:hypothetical protein